MNETRSLWVYYEKMLDELILVKYDFNKLLSLNISCRVECRDLSKIKELKSICTLILKGIRFD